MLRLHFELRRALFLEITILMEERVFGLLLGAYVGDSLGLPWEGESSGAIKRECDASECSVAFFLSV
jgi:ADP-ribosylglycohydrolase